VQDAFVLRCGEASESGAGSILRCNSEKAGGPWRIEVVVEARILSENKNLSIRKKTNILY